MAAKKSGLGRGFDAIFADNSVEDISTGNSTTKVKLLDIEPNREQPRKQFDEEALAELSDSIAQHGVLQPLLVRPMPDGGYQLVAGERRWRASRMAGLTEVPVVIRDLTDAQVAELALVENLQRENLNPLEEANGYKELSDKFGYTQEKISEIVGKSRSAVANALRLLNLPDEVLDVLSHGDISSGHARALLSLGNEDDILTALQTVVGKDLSVRETEKLVKNIIKEKNKSTDDNRNLKQKEREIYIASLEEKISSKLGRKSFITNSKKNDGSGKLEIEYYSTEDLEALLKNLCGNNIFE